RLGTYSIRFAIEKFLPSMAAGALVTMVIAVWHADQIWLLPGLWSIFFSLGIFASCRFLPPLILAVGMYYLLAGCLCLIVARETSALSPWAMAGTFGVGQLATSAILYFNLERQRGQQ
ncbi:MAG: hypothetical protein N2C12_17865, partial [Planctomycetales bacterium]